MIPQFLLSFGIAPVVAILSVFYFSLISGNGTMYTSPRKSSSCSSREVYTTSDDEYLFTLLNLQLNRPLNIWDGPSLISTASTTIYNTPFTEEQLKYYNWFTAAMYCSYTLSDLSCCHCRHFNDSVTSMAIFVNKTYGTKAMVTLHPKKSEIVLTLRGSVVILNWIMDFYLLPVKSGTVLDATGVKIHRGFYLSTMSVYNKVVQEIGRLLRENPGYRVVLTGHSLGGSMASLFTYFLTSLNQFPGTTYALVTYGQMRTGNRAYVNYMNALPIPITRVVARADIIPHIIAVSGLGTLSVFGVYYLHHGQEVWINGKVTKYCSRDKYEDPTCSNRMGPKYTLLDHVQYFATDYTVCYLTEGWLDVDLIGLPIGWTPTSYLPPMPEVLQEVVGGVVEGGYQGILPPL